jgi:hypothetical protein
MLVKEIKCKDYNGNERTEIAYFNLSKAELMEMELSTSGGFQQYMNRIINTQDSKELIKTFKELILKSYGIKSDDGRRFIKSKELSDEFAQTEAYSELFMELATNAQAAAEFANGIVPQDVAEEASKLQDQAALDASKVTPIK